VYVFFKNEDLNRALLKNKPVGSSSVTTRPSGALNHSPDGSESRGSWDPAAFFSIPRLRWAAAWRCRNDGGF